MIQTVAALTILLAAADAPFAPGVIEAEGNAAQVVVPGDFELDAAIVLAAGRLADEQPATLAAIVRAAAGTQIFGAVDDAAQRAAVTRLLAAQRAPANAVELFECPTDTTWVRDYGPLAVRRTTGEWLAYDPDYLRRSGKTPRRRDDAAGRRIAERLGLPVERLPLPLEGGCLLSNGRGVVLLPAWLPQAAVSQAAAPAAVRRDLFRRLGCRKIALLETLYGERTGHIDTFAAFVDAQTLVLGRYAPEHDPIDAARLDRNAAVLEKLAAGEGLKVVRAPMPDNADGRWRTYTNVVFARGALLVPSYADVERRIEEEAMAVYRRVAPGRRLERIDCTALIRGDGALRCVALQAPAPRGD